MELPGISDCVAMAVTGGRVTKCTLDNLAESVALFFLSADATCSGSYIVCRCDFLAESIESHADEKRPQFFVDWSNHLYSYLPRGESGWEDTAFARHVIAAPLAICTTLTEGAIIGMAHLVHALIERVFGSSEAFSKGLTWGLRPLVVLEAISSWSFSGLDRSETFRGWRTFPS